MNRIAQRGLTVLLLVTLAAASLASTAAADPYYGHRSGRGHHGGRYGYPVIIERHSSAGPAIVGFLGGLVLGSVLTSAHQAAVPVYGPPPAYEPPRSVYEYYDPYCREQFSSFPQYERHLQYQDHPSVLDVIDTRDNRCVDEYQWQDGRWSDEQYQERVRDRDRNWDRDRGYDQDRGWVQAPNGDDDDDDGGGH